MMVLAFFATYFLKINAAWLLLAAILIGVLCFLSRRRKEENHAD